MASTLRLLLATFALQSILAVTTFGAAPSIEFIGNISPGTVSGDGSTVVSISALGEVWKRGVPGFSYSPSLAMWEVSCDGSFFPDTWTPHPSWAGDPNGMPWPKNFSPYGLSGDGTTYSGLVIVSTDPTWPFHEKAQAATYSVQNGLQSFGGISTYYLSDISLPLYGATGVSADGQVVVGTDSVNGQNVAFRWTSADGLTVLTPGQGANISPDGSTIVGIQSDGNIFRWTTAEGVMPLGIPGAGAEYWPLIGVSAGGTRVVAGDLFWSAATGTRSLEDVLTQWYGLDLSGIAKLTAGDISDDGRTIVGSVGPWGTIDTPGFVVTLPKYGDANGDDLIDGVDYTAWADNFLQSDRNWATGDFNGDGLVNGADYIIWADNFAPFNAVAMHAVPEPASIVLAWLALICCLVPGVLSGSRRAC